MCKLDIKVGDKVAFVEDGILKNGVITDLSYGKTIAIVRVGDMLKKVYVEGLMKAEPKEDQETQDDLETQKALVTYSELKNILTDAGAEVFKETLMVNQSLAAQLIIVSAVYTKLVMEKVFKDCDKDD